MKLSMRKNVILMAVIALLSLALSLRLLLLSSYLQSKAGNTLLAKLQYYYNDGSPNTLTYNLSKLIITYIDAATSTMLYPWVIVLLTAIAPTLKHLYSAVTSDISVDGMVTLFWTVLEAWARPLIVNLCVSCLLFCYSVSVTSAVVLILGNGDNVDTFMVAFLVGVTGSILYLYYVAPWIVAFFYSVMMEQRRYGLEAFERGAAHATGQVIGIRGLLLNIVIDLVLDYVIKGCKMEPVKHQFTLVYSFLLVMGTVISIPTLQLVDEFL